MRARVWAMLLSALALAATVSAGAGPKLMGMVESTSGNTLKVKTTDGGRAHVELRPETRYLKDDHEAPRAALVKGVRVLVEGEEVGGQWVAHVVRIGVSKPVSAKTDAKAETKADPHAEHAPAPRVPGGGHGGHGGHGTPSVPGQRTHAMPHDSAAPRRELFSSDMTRMAGMAPRDPMGDMVMPDWDWMTMGIVRGQYNRQGGPSGDEALESSNWTMVMGQRDLGRGRLTVMFMGSLEPATLRNGGTPQLFQTGETFEGRPLVDRQHAHDFVMNLSATYRRPFANEAAWWIQLAPRGEPALGPTAYMHRASAGENPAAILSHHYHDATHITDSVITGGVGWRRVAVEASVFHGEEPDEGRWDIDPGRLDSVAGRVKVWFADRWSAQASHGFLKSPEALEEGDARRTTASLHYGEAGDTPLAVTVAIGRNAEEHGTFYGYVLESAYRVTARDELYLRAEQVDRDLGLLESKELDADEDGEHIGSIAALTVGYLRDVKVLPAVGPLGNLNVGVGGDVTAYRFPSELKPVYGDSPLSARGFLRLRWGRSHGAPAESMAHH